MPSDGWVKIELVHYKALLAQIQDACNHHGIMGFTSLEVHSGFGPLQGFYNEDSVDTRYYTFMVVEAQQAPSLIQQLKACQAVEGLFIFYTPIVPC